jgi:hypothetical protein
MGGFVGGGTPVVCPRAEIRHAQTSAMAIEYVRGFMMAEVLFGITEKFRPRVASLLVAGEMGLYLKQQEYS